MSATFELTRDQVLVAWNFIYRLAMLREACGHPILTPAVLTAQNVVFADPTGQGLELWLGVVNRKIPADAYQLNAPEGEVRYAARQTAGNMEYIETWIRDVAATLHASEYVTPAVACDVMGFASARQMTADAGKPTYLIENGAEAVQPTAAREPIQSNAMHDSPPLYPPVDEQINGPAAQPAKENQVIDANTGTVVSDLPTQETPVNESSATPSVIANQPETVGEVARRETLANQ